ncbi:MAG TPA: anti-sigma factor, partial [Vicinamibacterales bacterium]
MIPYLGCERARELLEGFVDGELAMADQVALESHLRWCRPCANRVDDMRLIGASMRLGSHPPAPDDTRALSGIQSGVLARVRAEREQSFAARIGGMFDDMRLLWPAVGATAALAACLFASLSVLQAATAENPESLAAMIDRLDRPSAPVLPPANPGSDQNPMRLDGWVSFPRALDGMSALESMPEDEVEIALSAVVTREGRIATYDLLQSEVPATRRSRADDAKEVTAVLDAVKRSRFSPAEAAGTKVAVNMVWLLVRTTARGSAAGSARAAVRPASPAP